MLLGVWPSVRLATTRNPDGLSTTTLAPEFLALAYSMHASTIRSAVSMLISVVVIARLAAAPENVTDFKEAGSVPCACARTPASAAAARPHVIRLIVSSPSQADVSVSQVRAGDACGQVVRLEPIESIR